MRPTGLAFVPLIAALTGGPALAEPGTMFSFVAASNQASTTISVSPGLVVIDSDEAEGAFVVADRLSRKLYVAGPDGELTDVATMMQMFGGMMGSTGPAPNAAGGGEAGGIDAMLAGIPEPMRAQIKGQIAMLPAEQQAMMVNALRGQLSLGPTAPGALQAPSAAGPSDDVPAGPTGRTAMLGDYPVREVAASGDLIWVTDTGNIDHGQELVDGMIDFSAIFDEMASDLPMLESSMFEVGALGGFPLRVETEDGEVITYQGTSATDIDVALPGS